MQSSDGSSEPNHPVYSTPQEGQSSHILQPEPQQSYPLNYPQPLSTLEYQPPVDYPISQEEHKFDHVSEPMNYPQPLSTLVYQPPENYPSSQIQQEFDQVPEPNHPQNQPQLQPEPMDIKPGEPQNIQSQPISQQPHLFNYQTQAYQPPAGYPNYQDQHQFNLNSQPQVELMDLKSQEQHSQNYQPPVSSHYSQEQLDYAVYNLEVQQGRDVALKQMMLEHITKSIKAPGFAFVLSYYLIIILGGIALTFLFPDDNDYPIMLNAYKRVTTYDYQISDTFVSPGSCQALLGITLSVPLFLIIFYTFNFLDIFASCLGIHWGMYPQFFMAGIYSSLAAYTTQQRCADQSFLVSMFGADNIPENPWFYFAGMAFASVGSGLLNYIFSSNKERAENHKKELAFVLSAY